MTTLATQHKTVKAPTNSSNNDAYSTKGTRISLPIYVDVSQQDRKLILNGIRTAIYESSSAQSPTSVSGIRVETASTSGQGAIENYLGMTLEVLRTVLFSRGGLPIDLCLRLQSVSGVEVLSEADIKKAFKERQAAVISYMKENTFQASWLTPNILMSLKDYNIQYFQPAKIELSAKEIGLIKDAIHTYVGRLSADELVNVILQLSHPEVDWNNPIQEELPN